MRAAHFRRKRERGRMDVPMKALTLDGALFPRRSYYHDRATVGTTRQMRCEGARRNVRCSLSLSRPPSIPTVPHFPTASCATPVSRPQQGSEHTETSKLTIERKEMARPFPRTSGGRK